MVAVVAISVRRRESGLFQESSTVESIFRMTGRTYFGDRSVKLLTVKQAAEYLNLPVSSVYRLVEQQQIEVVRIGRSIRIRPAALEQFLRRQTVHPAVAPQVDGLPLLP